MENLKMVYEIDEVSRIVVLVQNAFILDKKNGAFESSDRSPEMEMRDSHPKGNRSFDRSNANALAQRCGDWSIVGVTVLAVDANTSFALVGPLSVHVASVLTCHYPPHLKLNVVLDDVRAQRSARTRNHTGK